MDDVAEDIGVGFDRNVFEEVTSGSFHAVVRNCRGYDLGLVEHDATAFWIGIENINELGSIPPAMSAIS
jgi:hypothetical protein